MIARLYRYAAVGLSGYAALILGIVIFYHT